MTNLIVAKFGGSALGPDGILIPQIIGRINDLKKDSKVLTVFSAPLTMQNDKKRSLTDIILEQGKNAAEGKKPSLEVVKITYQKILDMISSENQEGCKTTINSHLDRAQKALDEAYEKREFVDEVRSRALAFSGEILMSHVMKFLLQDKGIKADSVDFEDWPIITDNNIESTNFLASKSREKMGKISELVEENRSSYNWWIYWKNSRKCYYHI